jgi:hypothetical protein
MRGVLTMEAYAGLIEMLIPFGVVLALLVWELVRLRRKQ